MALPELFADTPTLTGLAPVAITTVAKELKIGETTLHTVAAAPSALQATGQFRIVVGSEIMIVTGGATGTSWTVTRKAEGSTEVAHAVGASIFHVLTAGSLGGKSNPEAGIPGLRSLGPGATEAAPGNVVQVNALSYGAVGDARTFADATIEAGSLNQLHSATAAFTVADVGKAVSISFAGPVGTGGTKEGHGPLVTTIMSVSGGVAMLNAAATVAVSKVKGVVGTDNSVPLETGLSAARKSGLLFRIPAGAYLVTKTITNPEEKAIPLAITGDGPGATVIYLAINAPLVSLLNTGKGTATKITTSVGPGSTAITVTSASGFEAESYIQLEDPSQQIQVAKEGEVSANVGEIIRVKSVEGNILDLRGRLDFAYTGGTAVVYPLSLVPGFSASNMSITNPTPASTTIEAKGFEIHGCSQVFIDRVHFFNLDADAIRFSRVVDFIVSNCYWLSVHDEETESTPYSIECTRGTCHGLIYGCSQRYGRHMITMAGTEEDIASAHIVVADCNVTENRGACYDTHPFCRRITFLNCVAHNSRDESYGFQIRGVDCAIIDPVVTQCEAGINIVNGADRCRVSGGRISCCNEGIKIKNADDLRISNVLIDKPEVRGLTLEPEDSGYSGHIQNLRIRDVEVTGDPSSGGYNFALWRNSYDVRGCVAPEAATPMSGRSIITIGSAGTLTIPTNADEIEVTGTTNITAINANESEIDRVVTLLFAGVLTVEPGMHLIMPKGKLTTAAGVTLTLATNGTSWYEVARSS